MRHPRKALLLGSLLAAIVVVVGAPSVSGAASATKHPAAKHKANCTAMGSTTTPDAASSGKISLDLQGAGNGLTCHATLDGSWKPDSRVNQFTKNIKPGFRLDKSGSFSAPVKTPAFVGTLVGSFDPTNTSGTPAFSPIGPAIPANCFWVWHFFPNVGPNGQWGWQLVCFVKWNNITWTD
jgi:hypothetical protein